jgi:hypothetical protein
MSPTLHASSLLDGRNDRDKDLLAVDPVNCEPVSDLISLFFREYTGNSGDSVEPSAGVWGLEAHAPGPVGLRRAVSGDYCVCVDR